ncbi:hypothetical protein VTN02DRAFT_591 [Thermoascus thermophilus]
MGWWWSSAPRKDEQPTNPPPAPSNDVPKLEPSTSTPPNPMSRDEKAEAELKAFLASLEGTGDQSSSHPPTFAPSSHAQFPEPISKKADEPPSSIAPESLYPDTMSCRSAFDYAFFCQSFGGQFVNVYRYGELRSCSEHWENFWLCMKTKTYPDEERKKIIRDHYRKKAIKYKTGPSSEDVWELRTEPVKGAFQGDFAALEREMKAEEEARQKEKLAS